jgi:hypothetical protein
MATANAALRTPRQNPATPRVVQQGRPGERFHPQPVLALEGRDGGRVGLRLYTEQQVSEILQLSRSQLRKWRMGWSRGTQEGPPFKKIGRLIRYPESGLKTYIEG